MMETQTAQKTAAKKKPMNPMQRVKLRRRVRAVIQLIFFLLAPSVYTSCFSGIKEMATAIGAKDPISYSSFFTTLVVLCIYTIICGRFFCGYACAFGAFGDAVYELSQFIQKKAKKKLPKIPDKLTGYFQKIKYLILLAIIILCAAGVYDKLPGWSPWDVFSMLTAPRAIPAGYAIAVVLLLAIVVGMAFKERFFCQFLCPMGAIFALLPVIGRYTRNRPNCINRCSACSKNCPVSVETDEDNIRMGECISCGKCSDVCPRRNISYANGRVQDGNAPIPVIVKAVLLFAVCLALGLIRSFM